MNFLAHLFLAGDSAESLIGNLAGDFVKGPLHDRFTPAIRDGIQQHRRIDAFTDAHPSVAAFRRVLIPEHGHWSRVIADVFFDHFLACEFESYADESLEEFVSRVHATIDQHLDLLPERLSNVWPYMPGAASAAIWQTTGDDTANGVHLLSTWAGVAVLLAWAFTYAIVWGAIPASSIASCIARAACTPDGSGAVMWYASLEVPYPSTSP